MLDKWVFAQIMKIGWVCWRRLHAPASRVLEEILLRISWLHSYFLYTAMKRWALCFKSTYYTCHNMLVTIYTPLWSMPERIKYFWILPLNISYPTCIWLGKSTWLLPSAERIIFSLFLKLDKRFMIYIVFLRNTVLKDFAAHRTKSMPSRASPGVRGSLVHTASFPIQTPWSLAPISAPHIQAGLLRMTAWVCSTWGIWMKVHCR